VISFRRHHYSIVDTHSDDDSIRFEGEHKNRLSNARDEVKRQARSRINVRKSKVK
jgi:hypothetical protein